jgi:pyridoxal phosphate enzyme (YggS family)
MVMSEFDRKAELSGSLADVRARILNATSRASRKPEEVTLIAVTKTYPASDVEILHQLGVRDFGENRNAEGLEKSARVSAHWHFQGQIQSNKIAAISSWAQTVHSLDDLSHVAKFDRAVGEIPDKRLNIFIQISLDGDTSRAGVRGDDLLSLGQAISTTKNLDLVGLMVVPPVQAEPEKAFSAVAELAQHFRQEFPKAQSLSAGMSGDYEIAIAHGATHIRVGSQILGPRAPHA